MHIHLGLHHDGQQGDPAGNGLGELTLGPAGFLALLELHLGLGGPEPLPAERAVLYRECLARCDGPGRFYHRSFSVDPLGVAANLLDWRDALHVHGWTGGPLNGAAPRLRDLAEVEAAAPGLTPPGPGERLREVAEALRRRRAPIATVTLLDPPEAFPMAWKAVLQHLPVRGPEPPPATGPGQGFPGQLQTLLLRPDAAPLPWRDDGTVRVVRAETPLLAGRWLAGQLDAADTLLVAPGDGEWLDDLLAAAGQPRPGLHEPRPGRPGLEMLPLALELLWEPLDVPALMALLIHPVSPLPAYARAILARELAERPGVGGAGWLEAIARVERCFVRASAIQADPIRGRIAYWLEPERHAPGDGAALPAVIERVERLAGYCQRRLQESDPAPRAAYTAALGQCRALSGALAALAGQGARVIRRQMLHRLLVEATAKGTVNPLRSAEAGACRAITDPAAATAPAGQVIWWQLGQPALPVPYPWSRAECRALRAAGIALPSMTERLAWQAEAWRRPVLAARDSLILILPPPGVPAHPLWQRIEAGAPGIPVQPLETLLTSPGPALAHQPLPALRRYWQLPLDLRSLNRPVESYSSLELALWNPYQWLLRYPARLTPGAHRAVPGDFRLFGNLAHALIEAYFRQPDAMSLNPEDFADWYATAFDRRIGEAGAVLLMPGRRAELEGLRRRLRHAMQVLRQHLAAARVRAVWPELPLDGQFEGGRLTGIADLVLERDDGQRGVIDLKWSGAEKYAGKLRDQRALQLILYAELARQRFKAVPGLGYYILDRGLLLSADLDWFPTAEPVMPRAREAQAALWRRFLATWRWRQAQWAEGRVEVALETLPPPEAETLLPPESGLAGEYLNPRYNDALALAGWEPGA